MCVSPDVIVVCDFVGPPVDLMLDVGGDVRDGVAMMNFVAVEGSSVSFRCSFQADPEPNVAWLLDGELIDTDRSLRHTLERVYGSTNQAIGNFTEILEIKDTVEEDSGEYVCSVSNSHGSSSASEELVVIG
jgi:hypothetical protein